MGDNARRSESRIGVSTLLPRAVHSVHSVLHYKFPVETRLQMYANADPDLETDYVEQRFEPCRVVYKTSMVHQAMADALTDDRFEDVAIDLIRRYNGSLYNCRPLEVNAFDNVRLFSAVLDYGKYVSTNDLFRRCYLNGAAKCLDLLLQRGYSYSEWIDDISKWPRRPTCLAVLEKHKVKIASSFKTKILLCYPELLEACIRTFYSPEQVQQLLETAYKCLQYKGSCYEAFIRVMYRHLDIHRLPMHAIEFAMTTQHHNYIIDHQLQITRMYYLIDLDMLPEYKTITINNERCRYEIERSVLLRELNSASPRHPITREPFTGFEMLQMKFQGLKVS